jgi:hypothetical protein
VVEPVLSNIQTPTAKLVRPEPTTDMNCPNQTIVKVANPLGALFRVITGLCIIE